ncbi:MAG: CvpA family protein [Ruminococcaceae bacterium]|nr:CvpA family protein [Oscillospiraceae bacterium]
MLDFIFVVGLAIALYLGYRSGFASALVGFVSIILSAFGGYLFYPAFAVVLTKTPLYNMVHSSVLAGVQGYVAKSVNQPDLFQRYKVTTVELLTSKMAEGVSAVIINIISIIIIFFLLRLVLFILKKSTKFINRIPVLGKINQWAGMLLTGSSFVVACFAIVAVMFLPPANTSELSRDMRQKIDSSIIVKPVMKCNFFVDYDSLK